MAVTGRYVYCPMTSKRLTLRRTFADRIRTWRIMRRRPTPDIFRVSGYR